MVGDTAFDFVWVGLGADAFHALGFRGVCAVVVVGPSCPQDGWMEPFRFGIFIALALEHHHHLVGMVCL